MRATAPTTAFETRLHEFIGILKDANVRISTDEILSLFRSLSHINFADRDIFKQTLKTTLIKDYTDIPVFDRCFARFFDGVDEEGAGPHELAEEGIERASDLMERHDINEEEITDLRDKIAEFMENLPEDMLMERSPRDLLSLFLEEMETEGSAGGLGQMLFQVRSSMTRAHNRAELDDEGEDEDIELRKLLEGMMREMARKGRIGREIRNRENYLLTKRIYQIKPEEIREMRELIRRFGQKLKSRVSLRKKKRKHGAINIKKTLRASLQYGGVPFRIFKRDKKIDRPQLVVLCDVSGSVNQYTRFMLLITYTLQSLFYKVRTFAFISNMVEITELFREMDPERAINSIFEDTSFTYGWGSNYGRCFDQFMSDFSDSLNRKTTVIILGDARNNNQDPGLRSFMTMCERARRVYWLNPDKKHLWDWSDSLATLYGQFCSEMKEVNNFLDLAEFIDKLFPGQYK